MSSSVGDPFRDLDAWKNCGFSGLLSVLKKGAPSCLGFIGGDILPSCTGSLISLYKVVVSNVFFLLSIALVFQILEEV